MIYAILNAFGEGLGGGVSLAVVFFVCYAVARLTHGIVSWLSIGMCILIVLGAIQTNAEITIGEAISDFLIVMGLSALTVQNLISIIMGKYGNIKTNSIFGGLLIGAGFIVGIIIKAVA